MVFSTPDFKQPIAHTIAYAQNVSSQYGHEPNKQISHY